MPFGVEVGPSPCHFVLDGDPAPTPKGAEPHPIFGQRLGLFSQTAARIKMPLGTEAGLGLRDIVFDVDLATFRKKGTPTPPNFWLMSILPKWLDGEDAAWYGSGPRPRPHCTRRGPSCRKGGTAVPPLFGPCLLWPRSPISATAELLFLPTARLIHNFTGDSRLQHCVSPQK